MNIFIFSRIYCDFLKNQHFTQTKQAFLEEPGRYGKKPILSADCTQFGYSEEFLQDLQDFTEFLTNF